MVFSSFKLAFKFIALNSSQLSGTPYDMKYITNRIIFVGCFLLAMSCKQDSTPKGVLNRAQMTEWMLEVYLAEARTGSWPISRDSAYKLFLPYQDTLKRRKGLQDSTLMKSYQYYLSRPTELESIYDTVIDSLNLREQRMMRSPSVSPQQ